MTLRLLVGQLSERKEEMAGEVGVIQSDILKCP